MQSFLKFISTFLICTTIFGKMGVPTAMILYDYNFLEVFALTMSAGFTGNVVYAYLSEVLSKALSRWLAKRWKRRGKKPSSRGNRTIIRIKNRFGLAGIAFITTMFVSIPVGVFLGVRFFKDKRKTIIYFTIAEMFWVVVLYFVMLFFQDTFRRWVL